jgi:hypothetical protein
VAAIADFKSSILQVILKKMAYRVGPTTRVRKVDTSKPPMIATAIGPQNNPLMARVLYKPAMVVKVVKKIG